MKLASAAEAASRSPPASAPAIEIVLPSQGDATQGAPTPVSIADGGCGFAFGRKLAQRFFHPNPKNCPAKLAEGNDSGIAYFTAIVI
jgi:hypothetical protein